MNQFAGAEAGDAKQASTLGDVELYWRDRLMQLLKWGTGMWVFVNGWYINFGDEIELFQPPDHDGQVSWQQTLAFQRAVYLLVLVPLVCAVWVGVIHQIHRTHLHEHARIDATVVPYGRVMLFATLMALSLWLETLFTCLF